MDYILVTMIYFTFSIEKKHTLSKFDAAKYDPVPYTDKGYFYSGKQ